ncbi:hypothetical protein HJFPF1_12864 [Paramyrothecium foliicola]|nr:hypothetical protein HJFPF1_12864 [Paramyrothecium foliicola]
MRCGEPVRWVLVLVLVLGLSKPSQASAKEALSSEDASPLPNGSGLSARTMWHLLKMGSALAPA